jgi:hypothetical protein
MIMKTMKLFTSLALVATLFTSCFTEVIVQEDTINVTPAFVLDDVLNDYEIWYVDIDRSSGNTIVPFLQKAFTISFRNGNIFANNNLAGIGNNGGGFGTDVGYYDTFPNLELDVSHDLDGSYSLNVRTLSGNEIELFHPATGARYILVGYQRNTFDYDLVFYDNIHYFLQEYVAWEKVFASAEGAINPFDYENFLQFLPAGTTGNFRSSEDTTGTPINGLLWDYNGIYDIDNVPGEFYLKTLTLDYNFPDNEFFELTVINENTIELYQVSSGTTYRFRGKEYIEFRTVEGGKGETAPKLRKKTADIKKEIEVLKAKKATKHIKK